jgi:hypothetical protein
MSLTANPDYQISEELKAPRNTMKEVNRLVTQFLELKERTVEEAENKLQLALLIAIVEQALEILTVSSSDTASELKTMNEVLTNQLQTTSEKQMSEMESLHKNQLSKLKVIDMEIHNYLVTMNSMQLNKMEFMILELEKYHKTVSEEMKNHQKSSSENQLKLLSLQDQYSQNVAKQAYKIVEETFSGIKRSQAETFRIMRNDLRDEMESMKESMKSSSAACRAAATATQEATEKLYKFQTWKDYLYYAAPAAVLLNLIFRAVQQFFL